MRVYRLRGPSGGCEGWGEKKQEVGSRMKVRVFYPSIYCDGTVGIFTVGNAESACGRNCT